MKHEKMIKAILLALPVLALLLFFVPGMITYTGIENLAGKEFTLMQALPEGVISNTAPLTFLLTIFTLGFGIAYYNANGRTFARMYMVVSGVNTLFASFPLMLDDKLNKFPYAVVSVILAVGLAVSIYTSIAENKIYYNGLMD